jgi:predicted O-linked N-acetylglucosamine transferase (SPINDLY family)
MDYQRFITELPSLYHHWGQATVCPKSGQFQAMLEQVEGMTTANVLQLLNFAVACMEPGDVYCEVGCWHGSTLIGALLNHPTCMAYAVDNFSTLDPQGENQEKLMRNLSRFNLEAQVFFCNQDFEAFFADLRELQSDDRIGVYFYDGAHDYRSQLMGLLLVRPFLAEQALIIVDNSNWDSVQQANWDFIASHPECDLLLDLPTPQNGHPSFWNGVHVLSWNVNTRHPHDGSTLAQKRKSSLLQAIRAIPPLAEPPEMTDLEALRREASRLQTTGQFPAAEQVYRAILQHNSHLGSVWHELGVVCVQMKQYENALDAFAKAVELDQSNALYWYNLGVVYEAVEHIPNAASAYQRAIALDAQFLNAHHKLGQLVLTHGDPHQAELIYQKAISIDPRNLDSYLSLGNALLIQKKVEAAISAYEAALQLAPHEPGVRQNLEFARTLLEDEVQACIFAGNSLHERQRYREAAVHYQRLLELEQADVTVYTILAECYERTQQQDAVIAVCQQGIHRHPAEAEHLHLHLIRALRETNRTQEAIAQSIQSAQQFPQNPYFLFQQHLLLPLLYHSTEEIHYYRQHFTQGLSILLQATPLPSSQILLREVLSRHTNFLLAYQNRNDVELQKQYGQFVHQVMVASYPEWGPGTGDRGPGTRVQSPSPNKIRIGYISGCMWEHTVGKLMIGWLRHHNREQFEIYSYSLSDKNDGLTYQFRQYSDAFHQIPDNLEAICRQILADQPDVLVFFDLGLQPLMTQIAALRLAPVQCTSWAHPITSGLPTVDYFLSSDLMEPDNAQDHYSETLVRLPNIGISFTRPEVPEPTRCRADFQLREDAVVYLTSQMLCKYLPEQDRVLAAIARQVPNAQFAFVARPNATVADQFQHRLKQAFAAVGLDSDHYCVMLSQLDQIDYWSLNQLSDVFLDSFGWSGGHTTLEAIACNLPIVTCPGAYMRGRHSYAILTMLGITDTIAHTEAEYIDIAVRLGQDPVWRADIIHRMIDRHPHLYDDRTCVAALEDFYRRARASVQKIPH